jgi:hypothetical protein
VELRHLLKSSSDDEPATSGPRHWIEQWAPELVALILTVVVFGIGSSPRDAVAALGIICIPLYGSFLISQLVSALTGRISRQCLRTGEYIIRGIVTVALTYILWIWAPWYFVAILLGAAVVRALLMVLLSSNVFNSRSGVD